MNLKNIALFSLIAFALSSCNLEKEVELDLPEYESQAVVECYLEPGQPFTLTLTRSSAYFDAFPTENNQFIESILEDDALVFISWGEERIQLENETFFNPFTQKLANYVYSGDVVPEDYTTEFSLELELSNGEIITGKTKITPPVPVDSLVVQLSETNDTLARVLTYLTDNPNEANYYRHTLLTGQDRETYQDFSINDEIIESEVVVFGTNFDFAVGDTVVARSVHISEDYYRFLNSIGFAVSANGNPFGQPSSIISNIEGSENPIGIFTGFVGKEEEIIVE